MRKSPLSRWLPGASTTTLAVLLVAAPIAAPVAVRAQGFAGTAVVVHGSAGFSSSGSVQTINIPTTSPVTTINWTPTDTAIGGGAINFLPSGNTVSYVGATGAAVPYTVLNRIIPTDQTRTVAFNGTVNSTANTRVWFYSPGGLLIGSTASFNVGGLVLTAADPVTDDTGNFITTTAGTDSFSVAAAAGSTSAITIQPGANIQAVNSGQSNYIVAIAPQINQAGTISVAGSAALVAAESASFAVDRQGLFNITVTAGTTVAANTFIHTGSTGGSGGATAAGIPQRVYMVAVPKNNAITMAISSGGSIGFDVADAANVDGNQIVLSAGSNIADTGTGNPVVAGRAGSGTASLSVGAGNYTSNTYAVSTDSATVTDSAANITFASNLSVIAPQATVNAQVGTISVGGDLTVNADNPSTAGTAGTALVEVQSGAALAVGANAALLGVNGNLTDTADDALTGVGGNASLLVNSGRVTINGNALVSAAGSWGPGALNSGFSYTVGGTAQVAVHGGGLSVGRGLTVDASANATGADAALSRGAYYDQAIYATAGAAAVTVSGSSATISAANGITANANAISDIDSYGNGGTATGGSALIQAQSGATLAVGQFGGLAASANASASNDVSASPTSSGGISIGGSAQVLAQGGAITVAGVGGISVSANAIGGNSLTGSGSGGNATGGIALISAQGDAFGDTGSIATNTSGSTAGSDFGTTVEAFATGGNASGPYSGFQGGNAQGGTATISAIGANQSVSIDHGAEVYINAMATGGSGAGIGGGSAIGGSAQLLANGGAIAITNTSLSDYATATGGSDSSGYGGINANGGNATGGTVSLSASNGGTIDANISTYASAAATGGTGSGNGGNALGGNIFIDLGNNAFNFDSTGVFDELDASSTGGASLSSGIAGTAASAGGVRVTDLGTTTLGGNLTIDGNTPLYVQSDGSIDVSGTITGTGAGAYLHLWADDLGTGTGTVTLASGALNLPGNQIDIYYNPAALGSPTDYSAGVTAGTWTGYQLVDNINQLQLVGSYLSQNFALGKNIDASATQGWNNGAGFVPIGSPGNAFTGNFDGLNHTITNLYINRPTTNGVGLFGEVDTSANNATLRNTGLVNETVIGQTNVGGFIGSGGLSPSSGAQVLVNNVFISGSISGEQAVGGLVGDTSNPFRPWGTISNSHSDASVVATLREAGGLVGTGNGLSLNHDFATGNVSAPNGYVGGLVGNSGGESSIADVYATGTVTAGNGSSYVGGLIGSLGPSSTVEKAYATGAVTVGTGSYAVGGLVGFISTPVLVDESWASGNVTAPGSSSVGGFAGENVGTITNSYWDSYSTGQASGVGTDSSFGPYTGTETNLNPVTSDPAQAGSLNYAFYSGSYGNFPTADWVYDNGSTRPVGAWEVPVAQFGVATIASAHQVQLIDLNLGGNYTLTQNIDMSGTAGTTDIWGPGGFMPIGHANVDPPFTGILEGAGHVLSNLTMAPGGGYSNVGLFQQNSGTISDLGLANVNITSAYVSYPTSYVGAIAGINSGSITDSFATGTIALTGSASGYNVAGGLVGLNAAGASISRSYATVAVSGAAAGGGLVGDNEGAISETYANGAVSGNQTGGLVGESNNASGVTVTNSYWDTELTGQDVGCGSIGYSGACDGAIGLTTAQTLQSASFSGFTIDTTGGQGLPWRQYEGLTTPLLEAFLTPITVQPNSLTMQYTAAVPVVGVTTNGAQPSATFGTAQVSGLTQNAGTSNLTYAGGLYSNQLGYDFVPSTTPGTLIITPAPLTLAAVSDTKVYDSTTNSSGVPQVSGLLGNDNVTALSQSFGSANVMGANGSTLVVNGGYAVNDGNGGNNYAVTLQTASGTITPAALTLAAVSDTKVYDATTSSVGVPQVSGLFGSDSVTTLSQSFTSANVLGANASTLAVNRGYAVNDGNSGNNYAVTLQTAPGTITPAALSITYTANNFTSIYGTAITGLSGSVGALGLQGSDSLASVTSGTASFTTTATAQSSVGSYAITGTGLSGNTANYSFSFMQAPGNATALTIDPASLLVTADAQSRNYGATNPALTYTDTGLVNGDTLTGNLTTSATPASNVGTYAITQGSLSASSNYTLSYTGANLTINPASLTVTYTANPATAIYGNKPSGLSGSESAAGLVNNDTLASVTTGTASYATPATAQSSVGSYAI
ncbi:MAG: hypothetical protein M3N34_06010, partial [Pseudomonadota bacterium]|nr:hypothetical protein [Pseudomonadota bacterium]